ncbi:MAG: B12-binding domain-containing radical SAM protein [Bacteroidia bacterium]|nr:B12-binding domain-containing radical SAM protein [Bacteroidia bacterium]
MDILFTHSYFYRFDSKQWETHQPYPPLGTIYAAAMMREKGYKVGLFDVGLRENELEIIPVLEKEKPRYLVIYDDGFNYLTKMCLTNMREAAFRMSDYAFERGIKVIVCSSDSTDHYEKYLDHHADFVIQGEGEITLSELIHILDSPANESSTDNLPGIVFRKNGKTQVNPKRNVLKELDTLPQAAWDLVDMNSYREIWMKHHGYFTLNLATTRGCPYKCNWCAKPIYGNRYNTRSPEKVVEEIAYLIEHYQPDYFWMCDDIFGLKPGWVQQFRDLLRHRNLKIRYKIQSRVDLLLESDSIAALAESGLDIVWVGAESGSQKILDAMDKGTKVEEIYLATRLLREKGVKVAFFLQFGYLGETEEDITQTIQMVRDLLPDDIGISVSYPLPGTQFYEKVKAQLREKTNWTDSDELAMMYQATFPPAYYKKLHRVVHKEYRKAQGIQAIQNLLRFQKPTLGSLRTALLLAYYAPSLILDKKQLQKIAGK